MTTFTLQDLTPEQQQAVANHEEMHKMFNEIGSVFVGDGKTSVMDEVRALGQTIAENTRLEAQQMEAIKALEQHAPEPQPTPTGTSVPTLESVLQSIAEQFSLLSTVIRGERAQGNSHVEDQSKSLQETVKLVLQQGVWFQEMVAQHLKDMGVDDIAESCAESLVEREVEHYFDNRFSPDDHFDFNDAVSNEVSDQLDDVVRDRLDDVVADQLEELVAEKLKGIRIVFE